MQLDGTRLLVLLVSTSRWFVGFLEWLMDCDFGGEPLLLVLGVLGLRRARV